MNQWAHFQKALCLTLILSCCRRIFFISYFVFFLFLIVFFLFFIFTFTHQFLHFQFSHTLSIHFLSVMLCMAYYDFIRYNLLFKLNYFVCLSNYHLICDDFIYVIILPLIYFLMFRQISSGRGLFLWDWSRQEEVLKLKKNG